MCDNRQDIPLYDAGIEKQIAEGWIVPISKGERKRAKLRNEPVYASGSAEGSVINVIKKVPVKDLLVPEQPLPISIDNFFIKTKGVFDEIKEIPDGFQPFYKSKKSTYYTNEAKTHLVRASDHWGYFIRFCSWQLKPNAQESYIKISAWNWKKLYGKNIRIGIIHLSNLTVNGYVRQGKKKERIESRHPILQSFNK